MQKNTNLQNSIQKVYGKLIILAFLAHILFTVIFITVSLTPMVIYNIGSCLFYLGMFFLSQKRHLRTTIILIHLEITLFASVSCYYAGWDSGFPLYLIALSTLVYFCPFKRKYIPYLFSLAEMATYLLLKIYTLTYAPAFTFAESTVSAFYIFNSIASFTLILYAAFVSNLSAAMTEQTLIQNNTRLQDLVDHDALTHLWSRPHLISSFQQLTSSDTPVTIILTDIDDFKQINDSYGHDCGDYILSELSSILRYRCPKDTAICRWGGEEFVIMFPEEDTKALRKRIDHLRRYISDYPFHHGKQALHITMTFGISSTAEADTLSDLVKLADKRMYYGKNNGKNTVITSDTKLPV